MPRCRRSTGLRVEEYDAQSEALGIKGVDEIGTTGSAGAVANAVWDATGVRVSRFGRGTADAAAMVAANDVAAWRKHRFGSVNGGSSLARGRDDIKRQGE
jgi:hypothetical protein